MEKSASGSSESHNSRDSSVQGLSLSVANLRLGDGRLTNSSGESSSMNNSNVGSSHNDGSLIRTQQVGVDSNNAGYLSKLRFSTSAPPPPLFSHSVWACHNLNYGEISQGLNQQPDQAMSFEPAMINSVNASDDISTLQPNDFDNSLMSQGGGESWSTQNQEILNRLISSGGRLEGYAFLKYATDQLGSKQLQDILLLKNPQLTREILKKSIAPLRGIPIILFLMINQYGCYVFGKLIDSCDDQQLGLIAEKITVDQGLFLNVILNKHGANSIKKLIKLLRTSPSVSKVIINLCHTFFGLMTDRTASYVIYECLDQLNYEHNAVLYEAAIKDCLNLAIHKQGCISLNNLIPTIQGSHRHQLLALIANNAVFLSHDPSGNYVVQKVLSLENPALTERIAMLLRGHYAVLSLQKGGSHVVEKCLNSPLRHYALEEFLSNSNQLLQIARDRYGNYVIQKALKITKRIRSPFYRNLMTTLRAHLSALQFGYGKNVHNLIVKASAVEEGLI